MEKFKACEKEMKTKAYSKEGLLNQNKLDPQMREKVEMTSWVSKMVDELSRQVELSEAEVENLQGGDKKKKSKGSGPSRLEELESLNERRKWHINRLEIVLRLLENGTLSPDRVGALKEDIAYFVETNTVCRIRVHCPSAPPDNAFYRRKTLKKMNISTTNSTLTMQRSSEQEGTSLEVTMNQNLVSKVGLSRTMQRTEFRY
jgi:hypothetical protein